MQILTILGNFRSLNGNISVIVLTESWCDETANQNSLSNFDHYYSVHQTRKNKKGDSICIYIHRQLKLKLRNDIDIFNNKTETCSVEIINSKTRDFLVTGVCRPPKGDTVVFKNYCKDFLEKKSASSKTICLYGRIS